MKNSEEWKKFMDHFELNEADLSKNADLSVGLMNLISLEEHAAFSFSKTQDEKYLSILESVRVLRKKLLSKIVVNPQGEEWCMSKHLLAASMRLYEVGTKELDLHHNREAKEYFNNGFELYSLFFAINLGITNNNELTKKMDEKKEKAVTISQRAKEMVEKIVNCCKE